MLAHLCGNRSTANSQQESSPQTQRVFRSGPKEGLTTLLSCLSQKTTTCGSWQGCEHPTQTHYSPFDTSGEELVSQQSTIALDLSPASPGLKGLSFSASRLFLVQVFCPNYLRWSGGAQSLAWMRVPTMSTGNPCLFPPCASQQNSMCVLRNRQRGVCGLSGLPGLQCLSVESL